MIYVWNSFHSQWLARNKEAYADPDHNPTRDRLVSQIRTLYTARPQLIHPYCEWLDTPIDDTLQLTMSQMESWLAMTTPVIQKGLRVSLKLSRQQQHPITHFFRKKQHSNFNPNTAASPDRKDNSPLAPD